MNKKDRKFIAALAIAQTGIILAVISISGKFWHNQNEVCKEIKNISKLRDFIYESVDKLQSEQKINDLKTQYKKEGVGVEE